MKFVFRLQSFLNLKEKIEDQRKLEFGRAVSKLESEKQFLSMLEKQRAENIFLFKKSLLEEISPPDIQNFNNYMNVIKKRIKDQKQAVAAAEAVVEQKRAELVEAMKERKMLETIKDKSHVEFLREQQIAEQRIVDEVVSYRFNNQDDRKHKREAVNGGS